MTRFYITLQQSVDFVLKSLENMIGGELFVPKLPSCTLKNLAQAIAPEAKHEIMGIRPGEKVHEMLIPQAEAHLTIEYDDHFVIEPVLSFWKSRAGSNKGKRCDKNFEYASNTNTSWISTEDLQEICKSIAYDLSLDATRIFNFSATCNTHSPSKEKALV